LHDHLEHTVLERVPRRLRVIHACAGRVGGPAVATAEHATRLIDQDEDGRGLGVEREAGLLARAAGVGPDAAARGAAVAERPAGATGDMAAAAAGARGLDHLCAAGAEDRRAEGGEAEDE